MLNVENLRAAYGQSEVLHGLDLRRARRQIVAIMGRNGMGKTTLMKSLMGIVPERGGETRVNGAAVSGKKPHQRVAARPRLRAAGADDLFLHDGAGEHRDRADGDRRPTRFRATSTSCFRCCWR